MNDDPKKIRIENVQGGDAQDQNALKRNYFLPTGVNETYRFFDPGDDPIETNPPVVATRYNFSFTLREMPGVTWMVSNFDINNESAFGNWTNTHKIELDDGSFQAQAGPSVEETVSSATA
jgi:hypothetical protein